MKTTKVLSNIFLLQLILFSLVTLNLYAAERVQEENSGEVISIVAGQTKVMQFDNIRRVSVGMEDIADVKVLQDTKQLLVIAKSIGLTDLRIWTRDNKQYDYLIKVTREKSDKKYNEAVGMLENIEGVELRRVGDELILEGQALTEEDFLKIQAITTKYGVTNFVTSGLITPKATVVMDVKVIEIRKNSIKDLGVRWGGNAAGPTFAYAADWRDAPRISPAGTPSLDNLSNLTGSNSASYFGISTSLTSTLDFLVSQGSARFLAAPTLTCSSGGSANFLAGGEVPIPVNQGDGSVSVEFKQYGIILNMSPIADPSGFIQTSVEVEVSSIDPSVSVQGIPGFLTRKTSTDMNLKSGETMVLSGLLQDDATKDIDKLPGLANIPILGELFKSRSFSRRETELVILVTPGLIEANGNRNQQVIQRAQDIEGFSKSTLNDFSETDLRFSIKD